MMNRAEPNQERRAMVRNRAIIRERDERRLARAELISYA